MEESNTYINKKDLINGQYYVAINGNHKWVVKKENVSSPYIMTNNYNYIKGFNFYNEYKYKKANYIEIKWLDECIRNNKYMPPVKLDDYEIY